MIKVLLIEPDQLLASIYKSSLETAGYKVYTCYGAQLAIDLIDEHAPEVIVLELQLVDHNGLEFLYELRSYPEWQKIPVIVHTLVPPAALPADVLSNEKLEVKAYLYKSSTTLQKLSNVVSQTVQLQTKR